MKKIFTALSTTAILIATSANSWAVCSADIQMNDDAPIDASGSTITNVPTPAQDTDIANKQYVDAFIPLHLSSYQGSGTFTEAQEKCRELKTNGYADWRLPSLPEAVAGFANEGNSAFDTFYWTTTPYAGKNEWIVYIPNSEGEPNPNINWKTASPTIDDTYHVRCVR